MSISVAVIHNEPSLARPYGEFLEEAGFDVKVFTTAQELEGLITSQRLLRVDVALIHKGLELYIKKIKAGGTEESYIPIASLAINKLEETTRRIMFAGEFCQAVDRVVYDFKADHYIAIDALMSDVGGLIKLINKGSVSSTELGLRGESVGLIGGERIRPDSGLRVERWWG